MLYILYFVFRAFFVKTNFISMTFCWFNKLQQKPEPKKVFQMSLILFYLSLKVVKLSTITFMMLKCLDECFTSFSFFLFLSLCRIRRCAKASMNSKMDRYASVGLFIPRYVSVHRNIFTYCSHIYSTAHFTVSTCWHECLTFKKKLVSL